MAKRLSPNVRSTDKDMSIVTKIAYMYHAFSIRCMLLWLKSKNVEKSKVFIGISEKLGVEDGEGKKQKQQRGS